MTRNRLLRAFAVIVAALLLTVVANADEEILPAPTETLKTGRMRFHWTDTARDELETKVADGKRELMVHVFYPAAADATGERAAYVPDAEVMRGPWKEDQVARISEMRAYSIENAALPTGNDKYPVVIFAPGGGMKGLTYNVLLEDLASHGWIVAAIDPLYNARGVRFPDGRVLGALKPDERMWPALRNPDDQRHFYTECIIHFWDGTMTSAEIGNIQNWKGCDG